MKIKYSHDALRFLKKQKKETVSRIRTAIEGLTEMPPHGDIKPMEGYKAGTLRLKVSGWRVIFRYENEMEIRVLLVINIGNRGDIYKK